VKRLLAWQDLLTRHKGLVAMFLSQNYDEVSPQSLFKQSLLSEDTRSCDVACLDDVKSQGWMKSRCETQLQPGGKMLWGGHNGLLIAVLPILHKAATIGKLRHAAAVSEGWPFYALLSDVCAFFAPANPIYGKCCTDHIRWQG